jgi:hypothetical protein
MLRKFLLMFLLLGSFYAHSQIDRSSTTIKSPGKLLNPGTGAETPSSLKSPSLHSLSNKPGALGTGIETSNLGKKEKKEFNMLEGNGLMTYKMKDFTPKAFTKDKEAKSEFKNDQYLGDFITTGVYVELYCRDHEFVDGDRVRILVNGEVIHHSISLGAAYTPILVKLQKGLNTIEFEALNQGSSGPNTAELRVYDDRGIEVTSKEWNLLTGAKANMIVVKQ